MEKAFLSHSSADKALVRHIAKELGQHHCAYDEYSFSPGCKTLDEIFREMDESDIFVIFLSEKALLSEWVQLEIGEAWKKLSDDKLDRILPILIDANINHNHPKIPQWLSKKYNIRLVTNEMVICNLIRNALRQANFKHNPRNLALEQLFVGRSRELARFEQDINNIDLWVPTYIITYNFYEGIGRRKFLRKALYNENFIKQDTLPIQISLDGQKSVESFLMQLNAVSDNDDIIKSNLAQMTIKEKITMAITLVDEIISNKEVIFIEDDGCIVMPTGRIVEWFKEIAHNIVFKNRLAFCIISKFRPNEETLQRDHRSLIYTIAELEKSEITSMFMKLLNIYGLESLPREDKSFFLEHLRGIPAQVIYTVNMINVSLDEAKYNIEKIERFADQSSKMLLDKIRENETAYQMCILLSRHEVLSVTVLKKIFGDNDESSNAIRLLHELSVIRYFFGGYEHISLSTSLADFIKRSRIPQDAKYSSRVKSVVSKLLRQDLDKLLARDYSEFTITLQSMLQNGKNIPSKYFIPSLLLKDVITMYEQGKNKRVIEICEKLLLETRSYDEQILWQTRYWLTLALSKEKDRRAWEHLQYFKDDSIPYFFLKGFYFRNIGERSQAMACYDRVLKLNPNHQRSKREKVNILFSLGKYADAYKLAKENYESNKSNIYHIHSYFVALLRGIEYLTSNDIKVLDGLIRDMESQIDRKAEDMVRCMKGEYAYYVKNDYGASCSLLLDAIQQNVNTKYPKKSLREICRSAKRPFDLERLGLSNDDEAFNEEDFMM